MWHRLKGALKKKHLHIMGSYLLMVNNIYLWFYFKFKFVLFHIQGLLGGKLQVENDDNRLKNDLKM